MPIAIEGGRVPALLQLAKGLVPAHSAVFRIASAAAHRARQQHAGRGARRHRISILRILSKAAGDIPLTLQFFSLPDLPRTDTGPRASRIILFQPQRSSGRTLRWRHHHRHRTAPPRSSRRTLLARASRIYELGRRKNFLHSFILPRRARRRSRQRRHPALPACR